MNIAINTVLSRAGEVWIATSPAVHETCFRVVNLKPLYDVLQYKYAAQRKVYIKNVVYKFEHTNSSGRDVRPVGAQCDVSRQWVPCLSGD
jgi:hypothetical protein